MTKTNVKKSVAKPKVKNFKAATRNSRNPMAVRFLYQNAKNESGIRTMVPNPEMIHRNGKWFLTGHDLDQNGPRTFALDKIKAFI